MKVLYFFWGYIFLHQADFLTSLKINVMSCYSGASLYQKWQLLQSHVNVKYLHFFLFSLIFKRIATVSGRGAGYSRTQKCMNTCKGH